MIMAKFCSQCGRPLKDGEVCTCQTGGAQAPEQAAAPEQVKEAGAAQPQETIYEAQSSQPQGSSYGAPNGQAQGHPYGASNGQTQGNPYGAPSGQAQGNPYGASNGQAQGHPYGAPNGQAQGHPYGAPNGQAQGHPYGAPNGQAQGHPYGQAPYGQPGSQPGQAPKAPSAAGVYMKGLWGTILDSWKKPAATLSEMTKAGKPAVIFGALGAQLLFFCLIFMFFGIKVNSAVSRATGGYLSYKVVSTPMLFFVALLGGAAVLAVWGALAMAFGKKPMSYMQGLGVAAAKALAQLPFTAVTALFVLIFPLTSGYSVNVVPFALASLIYSAGNLLSYFFVPAAMDPFLPEDKDKRVWKLFLLFLLNLIATYIITFIFGLMVGSSLASLL